MSRARNASTHTAVLYARYGTRASYYDDWLDAFESSRDFQVTAFNLASGRHRRRFERRVREFDLVVLLHSCTADTMDFANSICAALQRRKGRLLSFVGNEVNLPGSPMGPKIRFLHEAGSDFVATQLLPEAGEWLYEGTGARVLSVPHALNPNAFFPSLPHEHRPIDIGARSFRYLPHLGDDDRNRLFDHFRQTHLDPPLVVDISNEHRFTREDWARFLNRCRGTISNEAGSFYLERDDATLEKVRAWLHSREGGGRMTIRADSVLRRVARRLPWGVKEFLARRLRGGPVRYEALETDAADFAELRRRFFENRSAPATYGKCISSRHFDAVGTKTCQIMLHGRFNDILWADEHYIALESDLGNVDDALARFRDRLYVQRMVDRTWEYVMDSHTYAHRVQALADALS